MRYKYCNFQVTVTTCQYKYMICHVSRVKAFISLCFCFITWASIVNTCTSIKYWYAPITISRGGGIMFCTCPFMCLFDLTIALWGYKIQRITHQCRSGKNVRLSVTLYSYTLFHIATHCYPSSIVRASLRLTDIISLVVFGNILPFGGEVRINYPVK